MPSTALETVCPAAGLRLLAVGRVIAESAGHTVSTVLLVGVTAVTFIASTCVLGVSMPAGAVTLPTEAGPRTLGRPWPIRLSAIRVGDIGVNRRPSGTVPSSITPTTSTTRWVVCEV